VLEKHADGRISFVKNYTIGTAKNGYGNEWKTPVQSTEVSCGDIG
jgi:hypothetical protein